MQITIADRLKPFSHLPGTYFILPRTFLRAQIFPTLIRIDDLSGEIPKCVDEMTLDFQGPFEDFTIQQDLEKGCLRVWGMTAKGFMRYRLAASGASYKLTMEKSPELNKSVSEQPQEVKGVLNLERLSLGANKSQDWTMLVRRRNLAEIFPLWHRLGQLTSAIENASVSREKTLFEECRLAIGDGARDRLLAPFINLFLAGFEGGLSPRLQDQDFQGFGIPVISSSTPLALLTKGAELIRSLFVQCDAHLFSILPALPSEFHSGRMTNVHCEGYGKVDLEWSKKKIRRMVFHSETSSSLNIDFQKEIKSFRLRMGNHDRGQRYSVQIPITFQAGQIYWFDNFEQ